MITREILCSYSTECSRKKSVFCLDCKNNRLRNKEVDFYEKADDKPIPDKCPRLTYSGPAEQTVGYECPVCGHHTNPYALGEDKLCNGCGYKLNVG